MSRLPVIHTHLSPMELLIDAAASVPGAAGSEHPFATIGTAQGSLQGTLIGCSLTPRDNQSAASTRQYDQAFLYLRREDQDVTIIALSSIQHLALKT